MIGFDKLNDMQKKAVLQTEGPVLILAGAGSGKTGALTVRIAHLLETGVKPWNILAITFTNKAAKEMRERVEKLVGDTARDMWISTFHSTCVRILRREIQHLDYENQFSIYDSDDQEKIMREAFKRLNMSTTDKTFSVKGAMSIISHLKEEMTSWEDYAQHVDKNDLKAVRIAKVYQTYQKMLKENNALDFDDLIYKTVLLFRQYPDVLEKYQESFRYIMLDQYQDIREQQEELIVRNRLLQKTYEKEAERRKTEEQNRLLNMIQNQTVGQLELLSQLMDELEKTESRERYDLLLGKIVVIGTYLKRRKNLVLTQYTSDGNVLTMEDLRQSLAESCDSLKLCRIRAAYYVENGDIQLNAEDILKCYDTFEWLAERLSDVMQSMFYRVSQIDDDLRISVHIASEADLCGLMSERPDLKVQQEDEKEWFVGCSIFRKRGGR